MENKNISSNTIEAIEEEIFFTEKKIKLEWDRYRQAMTSGQDHRGRNIADNIHGQDMYLKGLQFALKKIKGE